MSKTREVACKYYVAEGHCSKGRDGIFRKQCQICSLYDPIPGGRPARKDLRHEKKDKYNKDRRNWE